MKNKVLVVLLLLVSVGLCFASGQTRVENDYLIVMGGGTIIKEGEIIDETLQQCNKCNSPVKLNVFIESHQYEMMIEMNLVKED